MDKKNKKPLTMMQSFVLAIAIPGSILFVVFIALLVLGIIYVLTGNRTLLFSLIAFFVVAGFIYALAAILIVRRLYSAYFEGLYGTTLKNLETLGANEKVFHRYPKVDIDELNQLNEVVEVVESRFASSVLVSTAPDYSSLNLKYIDEEKSIVTFNSFSRELNNLIFISKNYRNVVIDASFDVNEEVEESDLNHLLEVCDKAFSDYPKRLYAFRDNNKSLIIYLPVIDSFVRIREQIEMIIRECSISIKGMSGTTHVPARFSLVCYPYSDVEDLLSDLRYAKRQGKPINFYLPDRVKYNNDNNPNMVTESMNINFINKSLGKFSSLKYDEDSDISNQEIIKSILNDISSYFDIDEAGVIILDDAVLEFKHFIHLYHDYKIDETVEKVVVDAFSNSADEDHTFYFSTRRHATNDIGQYIDLNNISSGFVYMIKTDENTTGLIYLFKRDNKEFIIDTYIRERLFDMAFKIETYFHELAYIKDVEFHKSQSEYILALSKYSLYRVSDNFELTYFSPDMKNFYPDIKVGEKCHKALFNHENICRDCPIRTFKKMSYTYNNRLTQVSLSLNDRKSHNRSLLMEFVEDNETTGDMYNKDLLISSYLALKQNVDNSYHINSRGYLLLLCFDNLDTIIENQGSEGVLFVLRSFIKKLKKALKTNDIYYYNQESIALLLHGIGHVDVINICEKIFEVSQEHYLDDGSEDYLKITYLPLAWPRGYANTGDFLRHVSDFYHNGEHERGKDFIYFADHSISRSASKRVFMLSVIEEEFSSKSFSSVSLQPIVVAKDKRIFGAEILLRINNVYSNAVFNAEEISRIAEQENKTNLITESIVNFIGTMYKEYGNNVFKINNFSRIAINIDSTYLRDPSLIKGIIGLNSTYQFPRGFLSFEIPEDIIPNYTSEIQALIKQLANAHINMSVDRYTGKYIGVEKLKEIGFNEIKMTRDLVGKIDTDSVRFNEVSDIVNTAKAIGIHTACVGVENSAQFTILRELDENMMMQGFHFYKPLSRSDFISALISHNN